MSLTQSDDEHVFECIRHDHSQDQQISDREAKETDKDVLRSDINTNSASSVTTSSGKENPEEDYIRNHLKKYSWYHGMMFGNIVEKMLKWENSFLVRRIITKGTKKCLCISMKSNQKIVHFGLNQNENGWICTKLLEKYPKIPKKRHEHIYQLINSWSATIPSIIPVPRRSMVLQHNQITLSEFLGKGAFGEVYKAKFMALGASESIEVAAKRVKGDAKREQIQEFCHEASIMQLLHHENVVAFYGIASLEEPIMVLMEMVTGGDLKKYLQTTKNISKAQIIYFALNIASGMRHLSSRNVIHRDLAARNCLITKDLKVKISDFGLSIVGVDIIQKRLKKAPIRWLAPETLVRGVFNEKTDVWSFGVLLTELMTRCSNDPLHPMSLRDAQEWIKNADWPHRITNGDPKELADIVDMCCDKNPEARVNFTTVKRRIHALYEHCINPTANITCFTPQAATVTLEPKKSLDRARSLTSVLTRKKSLDGAKSKSTTTRRRFMSLRRKNKELTLPTGMTTNALNPSPPTNPSPSTVTTTTTATASTTTTTSSGRPANSPAAQ